ncbi:unnamed protein product, partial [Pleuronectes platessa]
PSTDDAVSALSPAASFIFPNSLEDWVPSGDTARHAGCRGLSATTIQPSATNTEMKLLSAELGPGSRWSLVQVQIVSNPKQSITDPGLQGQKQQYGIK